MSNLCFGLIQLSLQQNILVLYIGVTAFPIAKLARQIANLLAKVGILLPQDRIFCLKIADLSTQFFPHQLQRLKLINNCVSGNDQSTH